MPFLFGGSARYGRRTDGFHKNEVSPGFLGYLWVDEKYGACRWSGDYILLQSTSILLLILVAVSYQIKVSYGIYSSSNATFADSANLEKIERI